MVVNTVPPNLEKPVINFSTLWCLSSIRYLEQGRWVHADIAGYVTKQSVTFAKGRH